MSTEELHEKLHRLLDLKKCLDENYIREPIDKKLRDKIYELQKGMCYLCKAKTGFPVTHHIQPEGDNTEENLVMLCPLCHKWTHWILKKYLGYRATMMRF